MVISNLWAFAMTKDSIAHLVKQNLVITSTISLSIVLVAIRVKTTGRSTDHCITEKWLKIGIHTNMHHIPEANNFSEENHLTSWAGPGFIYMDKA